MKHQISVKVYRNKHHQINYQFILMEFPINSSLREILWQEISPRVHQINKPLACLIDAIDPSPQLPLLEMTYHYGDTILDDGTLLLPNADNLQKHDLTYSHIPLLLILHHNTELFIKNNYTVPFGVIEPGQLLGLYEVVDHLLEKKTTKPRWCVSAGVKTLCILDNLSDSKGHHRLAKYLKTAAYDHDINLMTHWDIIKAIANHPGNTPLWSCKVIAFPQAWFTHYQDPDPSWQDFYDYLLKMAWKANNLGQAKLQLDLEWGCIPKFITKSRMKVTPFVVETCKHILGISRQVYPFFHNQITEQSGPFEQVKAILLEIYRLRHYYPSIMSIQSPNNPHSLSRYYSMSYPILLSGLQAGINKSIINELRQIKYIFDHIDLTNFGIDLVLDYYHTSSDIDGTIKLSRDLIQDDPSLIHFDTEHFDFCHTSAFWKGCIRLR